MNIDAALTTFAEESRELLEQMENQLLSLERGEGDGDILNAVFRAAHTIKGSAGLFGLNATVEFTHGVENLLDEIRAGKVAVTPANIALLLQARDHIARLVFAELAGEVITPEQTSAGVHLSALINQGLGVAEVAATTVNKPELATTENAVGEGATPAGLWFLQLRFGRNVLQDGMDPLAFIRYLERLGTITEWVLLTAGLPSLAEANAEVCYLGFALLLQSDHEHSEIEAVFDFVRDDSNIEILPPSSPESEYLRVLATHNATDDRLTVETTLQRGGLLRPEHERLVAVLLEPNSASAAVGPTAPPAQATSTKAAKDPISSDAKMGDGRFIRVEASKLDDLIDMVGELIISGACTRILADKVGGEIAEAVSSFTHLVEGLRASALSLRMVAIGPTFERFRRTVRDVSAQLGKEVDLVIEGAETELDKMVVERMADPLMHLVRNALDHGIKDPAYRIARNKSPRGTLTLRAYYDASSVVIEVADDGAGLPREKVLAKARQLGVVSETANLTDHEIDQLIFAPGFSTAEQVSNISGRGVGMDVVKRNIEALRGDIQLLSTAGKGTVVRIRLPLTLAIIDGFLVSSGGARFVIPLDMMVECLELSPLLERSARQRGNINLRGEALPCAWLKEVFDIEDPFASRANIVVVKVGRERFGLVVDSLHGETQAVIKPLGKLFRGLRGVVGASIQGDGEVALILDVPGILQILQKQPGRLSSAAA